MIYSDTHVNLHFPPLFPLFPNLPNGQVCRDIRVLASHARRPLQGLDEGGLEAFLFRVLRWRGRARCYGRRRVFSPLLL